MSAPTSASIKLWYLVWSPNMLQVEPDRILVDPAAIVLECKQEILKAVGSNTPRHRVQLYSTVNKNIHLRDLQKAVGTLSFSSLGSPLPAHEQLKKFVGRSPPEDQLHLIVVDLTIPLKIVCFVNIREMQSLQMSRDDLVIDLSSQVKAMFAPEGRAGGSSVFLYKSSFREALGDEEPQPLSDMQITVGTAFCDVPFSKLPCVVIGTQHVRKHHLDLDVKRESQKLRTIPPLSMTVSVYYQDQIKSDFRLYDYRTPGDPEELPEKDLAPIEVLYEGFGQFSDVLRATSTPGCTPVDKTLEDNVDDFASQMARLFVNETARQNICLAKLNTIFRVVFGADNAIVATSVSMAAQVPKPHPPKSDGHYVHGSSRIPCFIVGVKNEVGATSTVPILELVEYYRHLVNDVCQLAPDALGKSRLPVLGMTVVGHAITFYAVASVGSPVYVPLMGAIRCLPIDCAGNTRRQLYAAFNAAFVLLGRIIHDAEMISTAPPILHHFFPDIHELPTYREPNTMFKFQITTLLSKGLSRHVYRARSQDGADLVVKLARSYSLDLHDFCFQLGHAPELYAAKNLPGGFIAVAMQFIDGVVLQVVPGITPAHRTKWTKELKGLVAQFHAAQFVHGDLRPPNFICVDSKILLLDFDWGGKEGEVSYPHRRLNPQLKEGRDMDDLTIRKVDDIRILKDTLRYISELTLLS